MKVKYNIEKLSEILNDLSVLTGIRISFLDTEYKEVCTTRNVTDFCNTYQSFPEFKKECTACDRRLHSRCKQSGKYEWHICHAGLYDAAMPVIKSGEVVGNIIMGRIRCNESPREYYDEENATLSKLYKELPLFSEKQLSSLRTLLSNILFSTAIEIEYNETAEEIKEYIEKNITQNLNINMLCKTFFISKNYLYKIFKEHYNCTINEYIINSRINKAKELIKETKLPIYLICEEVGIQNHTYFCKIFKKRVGISPAEYRKKSRTLA